MMKDRPCSDYVSIDLETTGLDPKKEKIIEIGAVKVINGIVTDTFETFVDPGKQLTDATTKITGITENDLIGAKDMKVILGDLLDFIEDLPLVGHRILFDYSFQKKAAVNQGLEFEKKGIDTLQIARIYLPELESKKLEDLCKHFLISHDAHRALSDARATHELFLKLQDRFGIKEEALEYFIPRPLVYKVKKEGPITRPQKERLYRLLEAHQIQSEFEVEKMTKNEASRYIDQILSRFGKVL